MTQSEIIQIVQRCMRDVSLIVIRLVDGAAPADPAAFQSHCMSVLDQLGSDLLRQGASSVEVEQAVYAASCLLDEAALQKLEGAVRTQWQAAPLQVSRFGNLQGGELVYEQIAAELSKPAPSIYLLACWQLVLGLGFQGRYALKDTAQRHQLMMRLDERLGPPAMPPAPAGGKRMLHWRSFSALMWALLAWLGTGVLYLLLRAWLYGTASGLGQ